jgi:hypothetical protein
MPLPQLAIAGQCTLEERFLVVRGKLRIYRIHLGSANIKMEPITSISALCRVGASRTVLSIILSKAFLLAADDKITDPTILHQIKHL